jgi:hypothetical protein
MTRLHWPTILDRDAEIVDGYDTPDTLRQLYYRLVADDTLPNLQSDYRRFSEHTAERRRQGAFPDLIDRTSRIEQPFSFDGAGDALD